VDVLVVDLVLMVDEFVEYLKGCQIVWIVHFVELDCQRCQ
jgi:hypothetical protein